MEVLVLKNSIMINGNEVKEIKYDFESLSQKDMSEAEKRMITNKNQSVQIEEFNYTWHAYLFAAAAAKANPGTDIADYMRLTGTDALKARKEGRNFTLAAEDGEEENSEQQL